MSFEHSQYSEALFAGRPEEAPAPKATSNTLPLVDTTMESMKGEA